MMHVVMIPGSVSRLAGGLFTSVRRLSESLAERDGVKMAVVGLRDAYTADDLARWSTPPVVLEGGGLIRGAIALERWLSEHRPDLVHPQYLWSHASLAGVLYDRAGTLSQRIVSPRGMLDPWATQNSWWKKRIALACYEGRHLKTAACVHALCAAEAEAIRAFGLKNPICVIPNGVDLPPNTCGSSGSDTMPSQRRTLVYLGRIHQKKNLHSLLQAWKSLQHALRDWQLEIAGWDDRGYRAALERTLDGLQLDESVRFVGPVYEQAKHDLLTSASAFVLPSFSEGLPMAVLEAWAYGLPVLMTDHCNLPAGFESGAAKRIGTDPEGIAEGLRWLSSATDAELREMGHRGRHLVDGQFTWPNVAGQMHAVYSWLAGGGSPPKCVMMP